MLCVPVRELFKIWFDGSADRFGLAISEPIATTVDFFLLNKVPREYGEIVLS